MTNKKPFDKENTAKIPFGDLIELINQKCDYKFAIIDNGIKLLLCGRNKNGKKESGFPNPLQADNKKPL